MRSAKDRNPANRWVTLVTRFTVCLVLPFLAAEPASASEHTFVVKDWSGTPVFRKGSGVFDQCLMHTKYKKGVTLVFSITVEGSFTIKIINPLWKLTENKKYDVGVVIDGRHMGSHLALATDSTSVFILMEYSDDLIQRFLEGESLQIVTRKEVLGFRLVGVDHAMPRLQQCVYEEMLKDSADNRPFKSGLPEPGEKLIAPRGDQTLNDETTVSTLLNRTGLEDFRFLPLDERRDGAFAHALYAWGQDDIIGGLYLLSGQKTRQSVLISLFLSSLDQGCKGDFSYAVTPERLPGGGRASRVAGRCLETGAGFALAISVFPFQESIAVVVHLGVAAAERETARADEAIYGFFTDG